VAYLSVSGGWGVLYEALITGVCRLRGAALILHHNSFSYIDTHTWRMALLARIGGAKTVHVVLSPGMGERLMAQYPAVERTTTVSNAAFIDDSPSTGRFSGRPCGTVGYLCNISQAKGMHDVLALAAHAQSQKSDLKFVIAGPFEDEALALEFAHSGQELPNLTYLGPVFGEAKREFFETIDAFVFPTRYRNEAEPLVILEAMSHGCPVIAFDRGCISSMVGSDAGLVVPRNGDFGRLALAQLEIWRESGEGFAACRGKAFRSFQSLQSEALASRRRLLEYIRDGARGEETRC
jgi:glycosyltransferase involved in cell wall biosynthesis